MTNLLKKIGMWINGAKISDIPENSDIEINQKTTLNHTKSGLNDSFNGTVSNSFNRGFVNTGVHYGDVHFPLDRVYPSQDVEEESYIVVNGERLNLSNIEDSHSVKIEIYGNVNKVFTSNGNINIVVHGDVDTVSTNVGNIYLHGKNINQAQSKVGNVNFNHMGE